jgi:hypothetical protein
MRSPHPRSRSRAAAIPSGSMRAVNVLLAAAAAVCLLATIAATIAR